jgi:hypothetical protein
VISAWENGVNLLTPEDLRNLSPVLGIAAEERTAIWLRAVGEVPQVDGPSDPQAGA